MIAKALRSDAVELSLIPDIGGKIISLRRRGSAHDWIWHPSDAGPYRTPGMDSNFASTNLGGIDECLPSIKAQRHRGFTYSDHGQVWRLPAVVTESDEHRIITEVVLTEAPLRFRREIVLEGFGVHLSYGLWNLGDEPVPFIWAFHPLFRIEDGDRIQIQPTAQPVRAEFVENMPGCHEGGGFSWPRILPDLDLSRPPLAAHSPYAAKLFFQSHQHNIVAFDSARTGERLLVKWSGRDCPWFGLWLTSAAWHGHTHVAFEPTNYRADAFLPNDGALPTLVPGASSCWKFEIELASVL